MAREFVLVRLVRIEGADLNLFDFDYDLTWAGFLLSPEQRIYGRYGSRDASDPDDRNSLSGLRYAMQSALQAHRRAAGAGGAEAGSKPLRIEDFPAAKLLAGKSCIHCHQVNEIRRAAQQQNGQWNRQDVWAYPLPENIGLSLDIRQGDRVESIVAGSPASELGILPGDVLESVNAVPAGSIADVQYGLHRSPWQGEVPVAWWQQGQLRTGTLPLQAGWKKTNITWRPSLLELLPAVGLWGDDLTSEEKQELGLAAKRLAFRQATRVHPNARAAGVQAGDVIVGIDQQPLEMTMYEFLGHIRRNYLVGDRITLDILRNGQPAGLPMTLK